MNDVQWAWILLYWAAALALLLFRSRHAALMLERVSPVEDIVRRAHASGLMAWMLLVLDVGLVLFFVVLPMLFITVHVKGFHCWWHSSTLMAWLHVDSVFLRVLVWSMLALRAIWAVSGMFSPFASEVEDTTVLATGACDKCLLCYAATMLLWQFPWPLQLVLTETWQFSLLCAAASLYPTMLLAFWAARHDLRRQLGHQLPVPVARGPADDRSAARRLAWQIFCDALQGTAVQEHKITAPEYTFRKISVAAQHPDPNANSSIFVPACYSTIWQDIQAHIGKRRRVRVCGARGIGKTTALAHIYLLRELLQQRKYQTQQWDYIALTLPRSRGAFDTVVIDRRVQVTYIPDEARKSKLHSLYSPTTVWIVDGANHGPHEQDIQGLLVVLTGPQDIKRQDLVDMELWCNPCEDYRECNKLPVCLEAMRRECFSAE